MMSRFCARFRAGLGRIPPWLQIAGVLFGVLLTMLIPVVPFLACGEPGVAAVYGVASTLAAVACASWRADVLLEQGQP